MGAIKGYYEDMFSHYTDEQLVELGVVDERDIEELSAIFRLGQLKN